MSLNEYMQRYIFEPLGLKNINMFPTLQMKEKLAYMHQRAPDGTLSIRDHVMHRSLTADTKEIKTCFGSGGGGCFANPQEYCRESSSSDRSTRRQSLSD
jgi:CubicO group peptidase (beta-lactamase class C family)